jgi:hypothetical protein
MKISDLIKQLEAAKEKHGDIHVFTKEYGMGGEAYYTCGGVSKHTEAIYPGDILEHMQLSEAEIKELFPEYNGDEDTLEKMPGYSVGIVIAGGNLIYAT